MEFSRTENWNGQPFPSPGDLPNPGIEPRSSALKVDSLPVEPQGKPKQVNPCIKQPHFPKSVIYMGCALEKSIRSMEFARPEY